MSNLIVGFIKTHDNLLFYFIFGYIGLLVKGLQFANSLYTIKQ